MAQLMSIKRNLEVCPGNVSVPAIYHVSQGDKGTRIILGLMNNNENYTIPSGTTATIRGHRADGTLFTEITADVETTEIKFNLTEEMTEIPGKTECEAVMTDGGSNITATTNFVIDVERSPASVGNIVPGTNAALTWLLDNIGPIKNKPFYLQTAGVWEFDINPGTHTLVFTLGTGGSLQNTFTFTMVATNESTGAATLSTIRSANAAVLAPNGNGKLKITTSVVGIYAYFLVLRGDVTLAS